LFCVLSYITKVEVPRPNRVAKTDLVVAQMEGVAD